MACEAKTWPLTRGTPSLPTEFGRRFWVAGGPLPVEVFLVGQHPLHQREFSRCRVFDIAGPQPVPSPEDLVLRKLVNLRLRRSERDVRDLLAILVAQWETFDFDYVRTHAGAHRVGAAFERFAREAKSERQRLGLAT